MISKIGTITLGNTRSPDGEVTDDLFSVFNNTVTSIDLSDMETSTIAELQFYGCSNLTTLIIPATVTGVNSIGRLAFGACDKLTDVTYGGTKEEFLDTFTTSKSTTTSGVTRTLHKIFSYNTTVKCSDGNYYYTV